MNGVRLITTVVSETFQCHGVRRHWSAIVAPQDIYQNERHRTGYAALLHNVITGRIKVSPRYKIMFSDSSRRDIEYCYRRRGVEVSGEKMIPMMLCLRHPSVALQCMPDVSDSSARRIADTGDEPNDDLI